MSYFLEIPAEMKDVEREEAIIEFWNNEKVFQKSCALTSDGPPFVFYEGPPTTNGKPGIHHILSRVYKDIYIRYYSQRGYHVPRKGGWDCHGLPVEREVEKALNIKNKAEIEKDYGIARFNQRCRESVKNYISDWNKFSERMAFFIDLEQPYFTMDNNYIEVVWSLLKKIWDKELIYQGYRVVPYDPVLGTTMSEAEVDLGYRETEDPSLTVRFVLDASNPFGPNTAILVWTTTPWTLPSNTALAIAIDEDYILLEEDTQQTKIPTEQREARELLICAKALVTDVFGDDWQNNYAVQREFKGKELVGLKYQRLFNFATLDEKEEAKEGWYILSANFVNMESGTGTVHLAPAYGADDLRVGIEHELPIIHAVSLEGTFSTPNTPYTGMFFKDADKLIIKDLQNRGLVWKSERYKHKYPFGYRTGAPLLYYAKNAWYIRTTTLKEQLLKNNANINWVPGHIKEGRFGNWLENNRDWALSRERFWGTPLPVWTDGDGNFRLIGSRAELSELCGHDLSQTELHRPAVDEIEFCDPISGKTMRRVSEVIDCWFDSGAMPWAQWGGSKNATEVQERYFPADFISEAIDQTRGWFYTLLCVSTMVAKQSSYKNVVCLGHVLDEKGEKMSKSKGNVVDPWEVFNSHGADAIRWYFLTGAPPGNSRRVGQPGTSNDPLLVSHGFLNMLRNSVGFFILYANLDGIRIENDWDTNPIKGALPFTKRPLLDRWLLSKLQEVISHVDGALQKYDCLQAGKEIETFLESLSNWYIRRNRRRFWKGELDADKLSAYDSLYRCLVTLVRLVAPFTPFLAEECFQCLVANPLKENANKGKAIQKNSGKNSSHKTSSIAWESLSVTLAPWPKKDYQNFYEQSILEEGELLKNVVFLGRAARMQSGVKVRQPLARMLVYLEGDMQRDIILRNQEILLDELNVKKIIFLEDASDILDYYIKANLPRIGKRLGRHVRTVQAHLKKKVAQQLLSELDEIGYINIVSEEEGAEAISLTKDDLIIESISKEGTSGVEESGIYVALETKLTPDLIAEGLARDLVRNIQELRKTSGLAVSDRILLDFEFGQKNDKTRLALEKFSDYIANETLAEMVPTLSKRGSPARNKIFKKSLTIEGTQITIAIALLYK